MKIDFIEDLKRVVEAFRYCQQSSSERHPYISDNGVFIRPETSNAEIILHPGTIMGTKISVFLFPDGTWRVV